MKPVFFAAAGLAALAISQASAKAEDASWGCQILLCAPHKARHGMASPTAFPDEKAYISYGEARLLLADLP